MTRATEAFYGSFRNEKMLLSEFNALSSSEGQVCGSSAAVVRGTFDLRKAVQVRLTLKGVALNITDHGQAAYRY